MGSFFFLIIINELLSKRKVSLFKLVFKFLDRHISPLQISPFILYLYLNPLYSILGGSTILADPLTKKPSFVLLRLNPLYKWNILIHRIFVLSETYNHDSFCNNYTFFCRSARIALAALIMSQYWDYSGTYFNLNSNSKVLY